jgi:hypothetical protein
VIRETQVTRGFRVSKELRGILAILGNRAYRVIQVFRETKVYRASKVLLG